MQYNEFSFVVFFHICTIGNYKHIVEEMLTLLSSSGLLREIHELRYFVLGNHLSTVQGIMQKKCAPITNVVLGGHSPDTALYERFTLHSLHEYCKNDVDPNKKQHTFVLYIHSKGVSTKAQKHRYNVSKWRQDMLTGLTHYRYLCWSLLRRGHDIIGSFFRHHPMRHFSGNFWWSRASYLETLSVPIGSHYLDPEMWVCSKTNAIAELHNSPNLMYYQSGYKNYLETCGLYYPLGNQQNSPVVLYKCRIQKIHFGLKDQWVSVPFEHWEPNQIIHCNLVELSVPDPLVLHKKIFHFFLQNPNDSIVLMEGENFYLSE